MKSMKLYILFVFVRGGEKLCIECTNVYTGPLLYFCYYAVMIICGNASVVSNFNASNVNARFCFLQEYIVTKKKFVIYQSLKNALHNKPHELLMWSRSRIHKSCMYVLLICFIWQWERLTTVWKSAVASLSFNSRWTLIPLTLKQPLRSLSNRYRIWIMRLGAYFWFFFLCAYQRFM